MVTKRFGLTVLCAAIGAVTLVSAASGDLIAGDLRNDVGAAVQASVTFTRGALPATDTSYWWIEPRNGDVIAGCNADATHPVTLTVVASTPGIELWNGSAYGSAQESVQVTSCGPLGAVTTPAAAAPLPYRLPATMPLGRTSLSGTGSGGKVDASGHAGTYTTKTLAININPRNPSGLHAVLNGSLGAALTWTGSPDDADLTGYQVRRRTGAGIYGDWSAPLAEVSGSSFGDAGLAPTETFCYQVRALLRQLVSNGSTTTEVIFPSGQTAESCVTTLTAAPLDTTPPTVVGVPDRAPNAAGWYRAPVTIDWQATDDSGSASDPPSTNAATDGAGVVYTSAPSCDAAGNCATGTLAISLDRVAPTVTCGSLALLLNGTGIVSAAVTDGRSGPQQASVTAPAVTTGVGQKTVSLTGYDLAGNSTTATCAYSVGYRFEGFSTPVDNGGVVNIVKAGRAVPLKWRLLDANGAPVTNLSEVGISVASLSCAKGTSEDLLEEDSPGGSGLQNLGNGYYQLNWKTPSSYASSCKTLRLDLGEGTYRTALFMFTK
jgi:hypothetical protein